MLVGVGEGLIKFSSTQFQFRGLRGPEQNMAAFTFTSVWPQKVNVDEDGLGHGLEKLISGVVGVGCTVDQSGPI